MNLKEVVSNSVSVSFRRLVFLFSFPWSSFFSVPFVHISKVKGCGVNLKLAQISYYYLSDVCVIYECLLSDIGKAFWDLFTATCVIGPFPSTEIINFL